MAFQFTKASCVAVGTFNIYIIQPHWLTNVGILPKNSEIVIAANMTRPGFRLSSAQDPTVWFVAPGKLAIESSREGDNCGHPVAEVLRRLQQTPVSGLGNNVLLRALRAEVETFPALEACYQSAVVPDGYQDAKRAFGSTLKRDGRAFNLTMTVGPEFVELAGNVHLQIPDGQTTELAAAMAERFPDDTRTLIDLFGEVFGVRTQNVASPS